MEERVKELSKYRFETSIEKTNGNVAESSYLHLDASKFFDWIEVANPYERAGLLKRLFKY